MRKTKIICTLGPATDDPAILRQLMLGGMNVARLNFSHGTHEEHAERVAQVKRIREELGLPVALLLDTKGPELRLGLFEDGHTTLKEGEDFILTPAPFLGTAHKSHVSSDILSSCVRPGTIIMLDDGLLKLEVHKVDGDEVYTRVLVGGPISNHKSLNVPGVKIGLPYLSPKDVEDILFAIEHDFDYIAASFVRCAQDIADIAALLEENNGKDIQIIAKIENTEGVDNADDIIKLSDGIMVARGDMGVEIDFEELPRIQKMLIKKTCSAGKKCITATQMLDSMMKSPRPTRAETSDVANAVYDGTSAIMLSGETSVGKYPVESLRTMCRIAECTENAIDYKSRFAKSALSSSPNVTDAISYATCSTSHSLNAAAIITVTKSGKTARFISKYRPSCPIIGCTTDRKVWRQLALSWGVSPLLTEEMRTTDDLFEHSVNRAVESDLVRLGDLVVLTAGVPVGVSGTTNLIKVHTVGNILVAGLGVSHKSAFGPVCVCENAAQALATFEQGDILVIAETSNELMPILKHTKAIITEKGGAGSHAATVGLLLDIPVVCGAENATALLKNGAIVTVDGERGLVYSGVANV